MFKYIMHKTTLMESLLTLVEFSLNPILYGRYFLSYIFSQIIFINALKTIAALIS